MLQGVWLLRPKRGSKQEEQPRKPNSGQSVMWKPQNTSRILAIYCAQAAVSMVAWLMSGHSTDMVEHWGWQHKRRLIAKIWWWMNRILVLVQACDRCFEFILNSWASANAVVTGWGLAGRLGFNSWHWQDHSLHSVQTGSKAQLPIHHRGVALNKLSTGTTLPFLIKRTSLRFVVLAGMTMKSFVFCFAILYSLRRSGGILCHRTQEYNFLKMECFTLFSIFDSRLQIKTE